MKDPEFFTTDSYKSFYISVHSLTICDTKNFCSIAITNLIDVNFDLPQYEHSKIYNFKTLKYLVILLLFLIDTENSCYNSSIYDTCIIVANEHSHKNSSSVIIILQPMVHFIETHLNKLLTFEGEETLIYSHKNESKNGIIYKIARIANTYYRYSVNYKKQVNFCNLTIFIL